MAYSTGGFQVSVLPHYTPVDPGLVAFNPSAITQGVSQGMSLVNQYDKIRAFQAAQAEEDAVRQKRIEAANALSGITVDTAGGRVASTNAQNLATTQLAPARTQLELGQIFQDQRLQGPKGDLSLANISADLQQQPYLANTKLMQVQGDDARVAQSEDVKNQQLDLLQQNLTDKALQDPKSAELLLKTTEDKLQNFDADANVQRQKLILANDLAKATAFYHEAQGNLMNAKAMAPGKGIDPVKEIAKIDLAISNLDNQGSGMLDDKGKAVPVKQYQGQTYDPSTGSVKVTEPGLFSKIGGAMIGVAPTPEVAAQSKQADRALATKANLEKLRNFYTGILVQQTPATQTPVSVPVAAQAPVAVAQPSPVAAAPAEVANNPTASIAKDARGIFHPKTPAEARLLPKGTMFIDANGVARTR